MIRKLAVCASFIMATLLTVAQPIVTESTSNSTVTLNDRKTAVAKFPPYTINTHQQAAGALVRLGNSQHTEKAML